MLSRRKLIAQCVITARILAILAVVLSASLPATLHAAPAAQTFGGDQLNPFPQIFPQLKRLPAPTWLKEGVRVTYYVQSATITQAPDEEGGGGAGYLQNDVVAKDTKNIVVSTNWVLDGGNGQLTPNGVFGASFTPGVGDWWLNPAVLVDAEQVGNEDLIVVHMPATVAGQTYQAVRFEYHSDQAVAIWMFEEETGLLIYYRHTMGTDDDPRHTSSEAYLVNRRTIKLPWQGKRAPTWVKQGQTFEYQGSLALKIAGTPSGQFSAVSTVDITTAQTLWTRFDAAAYLGGQYQGQSARVTGIYQLANGLWLPATALTANVRKPLLDRDPVTGVETSYTRGNGVVKIEERGPLHYSAWTYDGSTGKLIAVHTEVQIGVGTHITDLALAR